MNIIKIINFIKAFKINLQDIVINLQDIKGVFLIFKLTP